MLGMLHFDNGPDSGAADRFWVVVSPPRKTILLSFQNLFFLLRNFYSGLHLGHLVGDLRQLCA